MALLGDEDIARIIASLEARGYGIHRLDAPTTSASPRRVILDEKYFRRIDKFSGETSQWQEWVFAVCVAVGGVAPECVAAIESVIKQAGTITDLTGIAQIVGEDFVHKYGTELFGVLCSLTAGEANVVVRSVVAKGAGYCGFAALCVLSQRFNPKTPARLLQFLSTVLSPHAVKDVRQLERAVEEWELKVGKLRSEFEETLSDNVKVAILTGMAPKDLQDMVFQMGRAGEQLKYLEVRDKIMSVASHRSQMATPTPMDIGWTGEYDPEWDGNPGSAASPESGAEAEVDAVVRANNFCYRCGGWGHFVRECGTPESKGKSHGGPKGAGKGAGKTHSKGYAPAPGKGYQGKSDFVASKGAGKKGVGKGYQGTCWTCGKVGHKAAECNATQVNGVADDPDPQQVASVGGVWMISQVSDVSSSAVASSSCRSCSAIAGSPPLRPAGRCWPRRIPYRGSAPAQTEGGGVVVSGRFAALAEEDVEEVEAKLHK